MFLMMRFVYHRINSPNFWKMPCLLIVLEGTFLFLGYFTVCLLLLFFPPLLITVRGPAHPRTRGFQGHFETNMPECKIDAGLPCFQRQLLSEFRQHRQFTNIVYITVI